MLAALGEDIAVAGAAPAAAAAMVARPSRCRRLCAGCQVMPRAGVRHLGSVGTRSRRP